MELHGTPWSSMEGPWNSMEFHGVSMDDPWNSLEFHGGSMVTLFPKNQRKSMIALLKYNIQQLTYISLQSPV